MRRNDLNVLINVLSFFESKGIIYTPENIVTQNRREFLEFILTFIIKTV